MDDSKHIETSRPPPLYGDDTVSGVENTDPVGFVRPEDRPIKIRCVADMTDEEREEFFKAMGKTARETHEENKRCGEYKRCHKTDWCRLEREKKEAGEKQKAERLATLEAREAVWLEHARQQEATIKDQAERLAKAEARLEKVAGLLAQMLPR